jgi:hypothetical protein
VDVQERGGTDVEDAGAVSAVELATSAAFSPDAGNPAGAPWVAAPERGPEGGQDVALAAHPRRGEVPSTEATANP